jgi:hypothetical protein
MWVAEKLDWKGLKFLTFSLHCWYEFDYIALQTNYTTSFFTYPSDIAVRVQFIWTNMQPCVAEDATATTKKLLTLGHRWVDCVESTEKLLVRFACERSRDCVLKAYLVKCMEYDLADSCWQLLRLYAMNARVFTYVNNSIFFVCVILLCYW